MYLRRLLMLSGTKLYNRTKFNAFGILPHEQHLLFCFQACFTGETWCCYRHTKSSFRAYPGKGKVVWLVHLNLEIFHINSHVGNLFGNCCDLPVATYFPSWLKYVYKANLTLKWEIKRYNFGNFHCSSHAVNSLIAAVIWITVPDWNAYIQQASPSNEKYNV